MLIAIDVGGEPQEEVARKEAGVIAGVWFGEGRTDGHLVVGGSYSLYLLGQLRFQPEFLYFDGYTDGGGIVAFTPNLAADFRSPERMFVPSFAGALTPRLTCGGRDIRRSRTPLAAVGWSLLDSRLSATFPP
jgi:hypothetical protein